MLSYLNGTAIQGERRRFISVTNVVLQVILSSEGRFEVVDLILGGKLGPLVGHDTLEVRRRWNVFYISQKLV